ncbi:helix-turn-helix domain-containing protein [Aquirufa sp.]|jgi:transcriptional regulator with XRE-family HTH domain|uniref:helix-turn-helix domain-containing protein n=1 Tax=Aquirufa sp. TaxID=2676249 RepID=UPI0037830909
MDFGARVKEIRTSFNYSQKQLSEQTGLTLRTIQRIENNEVKPSLHSLKVIGEALKTDLSEYSIVAGTKPYEFNFTIKITDMNQFINDLKTLVKNNWKVILWIILVTFLISNYDQIKAGIIDGWNNK